MIIGRLPGERIACTPMLSIALAKATEEQVRQSTAGQTCPPELRDACGLARRKLLVVGQDSLSAEVRSSLDLSGWDLVYALDAADARRLHQEQRFLVGLMVMPEELNAEQSHGFQDLANDLRELEWVAAVSRESVSRGDVQRLIVDHLRDFQILPLHPDRLSVILGHACGIAALKRASRHVEPESLNRYQMVGSSRAMREVYRAIDRVAGVNVPVLLLGETGTGKELVARAIHAHSRRASGPFRALNCAAIPTSLLQSELFGHQKGAYTGATESKKGLLESASGGTLFLDEIGDMPLENQTSLLRFLDGKEVTPVGGTRSRRVDTRVISATNRHLEDAIIEKSFREDLYYRLAVFPICLPPLRDRGEDIDALARHFLRGAARTHSRPVCELDTDASHLLRSHDWPGNLRELQSWMLQATLEYPGKRLTASDLRAIRRLDASPAGLLSDSLSFTEKERLERTLALTGWNMTQTARELGVSRMTVYRLIAKHNLSRPTGQR